uniref:AAA domain-containing protein n=1 Tax=Parastrongyloides trichosuri TaxID=131310 RepID=A0A0N5A599_PARTI
MVFDDEDKGSPKIKKKLTRVQRMLQTGFYNCRKPQKFNYLTAGTCKGALPTMPYNEPKKVDFKHNISIARSASTPYNSRQCENFFYTKENSQDNKQIDGENFFNIPDINYQGSSQIVGESLPPVEEEFFHVDSQKKILPSDGIIGNININNKRLRKEDEIVGPVEKIPKLNDINEPSQKNFKSMKIKSKVQPHHEKPKFITASNKDPMNIKATSIKEVSNFKTSMEKDSKLEVLPLVSSITKQKFSKGSRGQESKIFLEGALKGCQKHLVKNLLNELIELDEIFSWDSISGLKFEKSVLREAIVYPISNSNLFKTKARKPPGGVLLFGPPGTGKTLLAKCVASQCHATFFNISASSLTSKWVGEGEKTVKALFGLARFFAPSVIFIDEIDSLLCKRGSKEADHSRKLKTEFLIQLDGMKSCNKKVVLLAATNKASELDEAARRRLNRRLLIQLPEPCARKNLLLNQLGSNHILSEEDINEIIKDTHGFSGADMAELCHEASRYPIRELRHRLKLSHIIPDSDVRKINKDDYKMALKCVKRTVSEKEAELYKNFAIKFGTNF